MSYEPNEVIFREGVHNHSGDENPDGGYISSFSLGNFFSSSGDCPDKNPHALYFIDTKVTNGGDGISITEAKATTLPIVVLYKGDKPVSVDYRYIANAPKITIEDYGLNLDKLFSLYRP